MSGGRLRAQTGQLGFGESLEHELAKAEALMSAINRFRTAISDELKARDNDRRLEAWICFLFALVVAPAAYIKGTSHWPYAAIGLAFTSVWLVLTISMRGTRPASKA